MIDFQLGHMAVCGRSRHGKTYTISRLLLKEKSGVIFFNTGLQPMPKGYIIGNGNADMDVLISTLDSGGKINFIPHANHAIAQGQLSAIINALFNGSKHDVIIAVDEAWEYKGIALTALRKVARRGLYWGMKLVPIVQRLANLNNDLMTQCESKVIFALNSEKGYFQRYELPFDEFMRRIKEKGKYSYCVWSDAEVKGAYRYGN